MLVSKGQSSQDTDQELLDHTMKMHDLPDEYLTEILVVAKKIAKAEDLDESVIRLSAHR